MPKKKQKKTKKAAATAPAEPKRGKGHPTDYKVEFKDEAYRLTLLGLTDAELASYFDIAESTLNNWKKKYPDFLESIKSGKEKADAKVVDKLRRRAEGYEWTEEEPIKVKEIQYDENGKKIREFERVEVVQVHKTAPPDTTAGIFWVKNRRSQNWRDKQDMNLMTDDKPLGDALLEAIERAYGPKK